jgi:hypothetical protein
MQFGSSLDSFPCFTRLNPCVAHCSTNSIPWVHHSREEGSHDYDGGFVRMQIHMNFDTIIYRQQDSCASRGAGGLGTCTAWGGSRPRAKDASGGARARTLRAWRAGTGAGVASRHDVAAQSAADTIYFLSPCLSTKNSKFLDRSVPNDEYESCRSHYPLQHSQRP